MSRSLSRQTTDTRISEVEIISMLTPASPMQAKNDAATPGCERMPAPISDTLPTWSSKSSDLKRVCSLILSRAAIAVGPSALGSVKEMSVRPVPSVDTFCTIMSMLISAWATVSKMRPAAPGSSGTPTIVIFASLRSWATPVISACSTPASSIDPVTSVPCLFEYEERTWIGTLNRRAYSTHRNISTFAPPAASSSISS